MIYVRSLHILMERPDTEKAVWVILISPKECPNCSKDIVGRVEIDSTEKDNFSIEALQLGLNHITEDGDRIIQVMSEEIENYFRKYTVITEIKE